MLVRGNFNLLCWFVHELPGAGDEMTRVIWQMIKDKVNMVHFSGV